MFRRPRGQPSHQRPGYDSGSSTIDHFVSVYDAAGNLSTETDLQNSITTTTSYSYDADNQLAVGGGVNYDDNGNRTGGGYTVGTGNQLSSDGTWSYSYDENGNQTKKSMGLTSTTWKYSYDNRNELISAKEYSEDPDIPGTAVLQLDAEYKYDLFGNRIEKSVDDDGAGPNAATITRFVLDGWNPAKAAPIGNENFDVIADLDGTNSNALETKYVRGDVVDQIWARIDGTTPRWYLTDRQGSTRDVIDNSGVLKDSVRYDGFGNITSESNSNERGRYAWTGREIDTETKLQYNRARYYDAATGRWISQDPLGFDAGDSNLCRYVHNNPTTEFDPSGFQEPGAPPGVKLPQYYGMTSGNRPRPYMGMSQSTKFLDYIKANGKLPPLQPVTGVFSRPVTNSALLNQNQSVAPPPIAAIQTPEPADGEFQIRIAAFISARITEDGDGWAPEPGSGGRFEFSGDKRDFGGPFVDSRIRSWINVPIAKIGNLPTNAVATHASGPSHRRWLKNSNNPGAGYNILEKFAPVNGTTNIANNNDDSTTIRITNSGSYPFPPEGIFPPGSQTLAWVVPNIDYSAKLELSKNFANNLEIRGTITTNLFPEYEVIVRYKQQNHLVFKRETTWGGPNHINLSLQSTNSFLEFVEL